MSIFYERKVGDRIFAIKNVCVNIAGDAKEGDNIEPPKTDGDKISGERAKIFEFFK